MNQPHAIIVNNRSKCKGSQKISPFYKDYPDKSQIVAFFYPLMDVNSRQRHVKEKSNSPYFFYHDILPWASPTFIKLRDGCWAVKSRISVDAEDKQFWEYKCFSSVQIVSPINHCPFLARFYPAYGQMLIIKRHHSICYKYNYSFLINLPSPEKILYRQTLKVHEFNTVLALHNSLERSLDKQICQIKKLRVADLNYLFKIYPMRRKNIEHKRELFEDLLTENNLEYTYVSGINSLKKISFNSLIEKNLTLLLSMNSSDRSYDILLENLCLFLLVRNYEKAYNLSYSEYRTSSIYRHAFFSSYADLTKLEDDSEYQQSNVCLSKCVNKGKVVIKEFYLIYFLYLFSK